MYDYNILVNLQKQIELDTLGFTKISTIEFSTLDSLHNLFNILHANRSDIPYNKLYTSIVNNDAAFKNEMHIGLKEILKKEFGNIFKNYKLSTFTFQIKGIGNQTELGVHQDWSYSNEPKGFSSYTFWLPLSDSHENNGTLYVIPESHKHHRGYRGYGIDSPIDSIRNDAKKFHIPLTVKAGEILLFDTSIIHYSPNNFSDNVRISVMVNITNQPEGFSIYLKSNDKENFIEEYIVPNDFFLLYDDFMLGRSKAPSFCQVNHIYPNNNEDITMKKLTDLYKIQINND